MNRTLAFGLAVMVIFSGCQKQETEEQRKAEIEREVQNRLAAERQTQQQQQLDQRERDLNAREQALADDQAGAADQEPAATPSPHLTQRDSDYERGPATSYNLFYTRLESYGSWLETGDYGYVWHPREAESANWRPYLNGHWVYTDAGWTWVSEEPFGWATYHYGRWTRLRNVGWEWVPGDEWAPAWVSWRTSDDYVGWAPLPPEAQFDRRTGIRNWADNYYDIGPTQYCFVPTSRFGATRVEQTVVPLEQNVTIINRTVNVTNITYNNVTVVNQGPNYDELRTRTQQPIPRLKLERQVSIEQNAQPHPPVIRGETIQMIAPVVQRAQSVERPRQIKQTIRQATVDRGWSDIPDTETTRQTRVKMKSEATPPPDLPPKSDVNTSDSSAESHGSSPAMTASPNAAAASGRNTGGRMPILPPPSNNEDNERPRVGGPFKSQARRFNPPRTEPMPSNSPQTGAASAKTTTTESPSSSNPNESGQSAIRQRPEGIRRRPVPARQRQERPPEASQRSTPPPAPTQSPTSSP